MSPRPTKKNIKYKYKQKTKNKTKRNPQGKNVYNPSKKNICLIIYPQPAACEIMTW